MSNILLEIFPIWVLKILYIMGVIWAIEKSWVDGYRLVWLECDFTLVSSP